MSLELCGSRLFAPFLGSSIYVWTSLIGIILASLSVGYWWGGRLADRRPEPQLLSWILAIAGGLVGFVGVLEYPLLNYLGQSSLDVRLAAVLAATLLFSAPSILLGSVSPFAIRLRLTELSVSGATIGRLYALSTVGSIFGTFVTGFYLFSWIGSSKLIFCLAITLVALSLFVSLSDKLGQKVVLMLLLGLLLFLQHGFQQQLIASGMRSIDTRYHRVLVLDVNQDGKMQRILATDPLGSQSAMNLDDSDEARGRYYHYYDLAVALRPAAKQILLLGGGAYSYPKHFVERFPDPLMTVVELDPGITEIARQFFSLVDHPRVAIVHEDARTYLNRTDAQYDVILFDVFRSSPELPFHLVTKETVAKMHSILAEDGILCINIISGIEGPNGQIVRALKATLLTAFADVELFPVRAAKEAQDPQNLILLARKTTQTLLPDSLPEDLQPLLARRWESAIAEDTNVLTDDFAPVERYMLPVFLAMKKNL